MKSQVAEPPVHVLEVRSGGVLLPHIPCSCWQTLDELEQRFSTGGS